ncbi:AAA family ATPase [Bradyrhizobium sp. Arg62]|uniref:AAA family ATPase n=1 Tax=Bradyrhizobium brasilense TaxID=1419277 RepID=UPI001E4AE989|nr:AAA family ATPase [Bradyrhizobium brasilense]MCC8950691.1 AAA family ATPase [Bradyrhizobium brasilense]
MGRSKGKQPQQGMSDEELDQIIANGAPTSEIEKLFDRITFGLSGLQHEEFPPMRWIVRDLIPEGATMLFGKPKTGKSWLTLDLGLAVAMGGTFLGRQCEQGDVLGLFLEDHKRRIQDRVTRMIGARGCDWPSNFICATEWSRIDAGGLEMIRIWHRRAANPRLVIVDILEEVRPSGGRGKDKTLYSIDYAAVRPFQQLAAELGISIMIVHHQRKAGAENLLDTSSGTGGLSGGVDAVMLLGEDESGHFLWGKGREIDGFRFIVKMGEKFRWQALGAKPDSSGSPQRLRIIGILAEARGPLTTKQIADKLADLEPRNVANLLPQMARDREIFHRGRGIYSLQSHMTALDPDVNANTP